MPSWIHRDKWQPMPFRYTTSDSAAPRSTSQKAQNRRIHCLPYSAVLRTASAARNCRPLTLHPSWLICSLQAWPMEQSCAGGMSLFAACLASPFISSFRRRKTQLSLDRQRIAQPAPSQPAGPQAKAGDKHSKPNRGRHAAAIAPSTAALLRVPECIRLPVLWFMHIRQQQVSVPCSYPARPKTPRADSARQTLHLHPSTTYTSKADGTGDGSDPAERSKPTALAAPAGQSQSAIAISSN